MNYKIFGWRITFCCEIEEWGIPFSFDYFNVAGWKEVSFSFLCFRIEIRKD
ncbi:hypothetical protein LCGC14_0475210 [marine sediment metagenome]|uniref:Uncharacterized protein n=1 Tax=marine sediment metagenome TaxID=412755 RepID=A0A0F9VJM6_9ZZZZ